MRWTRQTSSLARLRAGRKQAVLLEKLDHVAVEKPGLLDLAGVPGAMKNFHLAARDAGLECRRTGVRAIFAARQDDRRAGNPRMMILRIGYRRSLELIDDRLQVGLRVALGEHLGEKMRQRRRTERRAQVLERKIPAILDAARRIAGDALGRVLFVRTVARAGEHQRCGL